MRLKIPSHTSGPWHVHHAHTIMATEGAVANLIGLSRGCWPTEVYWGNARLITAAPEMFDELNALVTTAAKTPDMTIGEFIERERHDSPALLVTYVLDSFGPST